MRTVTIKGRDGQLRNVTAPANGDLSGILGDGETLIVPLTLMDGFSHRGYVTDNLPTDYAITDEDRQRVVDARAAMINRVNNAWKPTKTKGVAAVDSVTDTRERAFAAYEHRLTNRWRRAS